jgi:hypothetical protein
VVGAERRILVQAPGQSYTQTGPGGNCKPRQGERRSQTAAAFIVFPASSRTNLPEFTVIAWRMLPHSEDDRAGELCWHQPFPRIRAARQGAKGAPT